MEADMIRHGFADGSAQAPAEDPARVRERVIKCRNDFKSSWRNLAQSLYLVWRDKYYKEWGYQTFDHYTAKEVFIRKNTAMKLIHSYRFLEEEEPQYLSRQASPEGVQGEPAPSFEDVEVLRKAKKNLDENEYERVKKDLFVRGKDPGEVKKDLTQMIRQRKDTDPEEARLKQQLVTVKRFVSTLKSLKREIEILKILPGKVIDDIDKLIEKLEAHTE